VGASNGATWQFGKLEADRFTGNISYYSIQELGLLFGAVSYLFAQCAEQLGSCHQITSQQPAALPTHLGLKPQANSSSPLKRTKDADIWVFNPF
jgi:hypothetical protein